MDFRDKIISEIADAECEKISRKVILALQKNVDCLMAGDDSGLKNIWDEICVQVQDEYSYYWDSYVETVEGLIEVEVEKLSKSIREAIWLQTDDSFESEDQNAVFTDQELSRYIASEYVFSKAGDWSNRRIHYYIYGEYP